MANDWLLHYHSDERGFADRAAEWLERAGECHVTKVTDFLDPRQVQIVQSIANRYLDKTALYYTGGYAEAERQRVVIVPDYLDPQMEDPGIVVLAITSSDDRIKELDHGDYMGAILGLGIKRDKVGDIHVLENGCHCLIAAEIANYFDIHLRQVHRVQVMTEILPVDKLLTSKTEYDEMSLSVASMRLDGIISDVCRLSRAKALVPIQAGRCRVNFKTESDPSKSLKEGDVVSLQGFGRFRVLEVEGVSKKGRTRVRVGKYK
ncbi:MAG: RNA-binding protein [Gorillibacterium sp.]|nr:RNA-binding protein [Gorillibacterium sp.]